MGGVIASHNRYNDPRSYKNIVDQYGKRCQWLKNEKFLKDLEGDSVDTEILDEELRILQDEEPQTCRGKTAKVMETSPIQIAMCVLILVDAGIVITEILLDLHAMRSQQREAAVALHETLDFLRYQYADDLSGYQGDNVQYILEKLRQKYKNASTDGKTRTKRSLPTVLCFDDVTFASSYRAPPSERFTNSGRFVFSDTLRKQSLRYRDNFHEPDRSFDANGGLSNARFRSALSSRRYGSVKPSSKANLEPGTPLETESLRGIIIRNKRELEQNEGQQALPNDNAATTNQHLASGLATKLPTSELASTDVGPSSRALGYRSSPVLPNEDVTEETSGSSGSLEPDDDTEALLVDGYGGRGSTAMYSENAHAQKLLKIAHILHYASIAILGVFVLQVFLKLFGMGSEFFKSKLELFDGIIIIASFTLDLVFVEGISGAEGEEAIALLIIFLLWRILRVINGIMVTTKQRHEFRIKLQRRACRRAEKKIESLEEDISWKDKEIHTLKGLCLRNGVTEGDIEAAQPKRRPLFSKMNTSSGLSSIASLSLGFTMSMRPMPPSKTGAGTVPHDLPPSTHSSEMASHSQGTRSSSALLLRQKTVEESPPPVPLQRTGSWCQDQRRSNGEEPKQPRGCNATQSFHMKRIAEEQAALTTGPSGRSVGPDASTAKTVGTDGVNKCRSNVIAADKKTGNCSMVDPTVDPTSLPGVPLERSNDLKTAPSSSIGSISEQDHETSAELPNTVHWPEVAPGIPRGGHRSDLEPESFQPSRVSTETERFASSQRLLKDPASFRSGPGPDQPPSSQPPPPCGRSVEGSGRWFRWKSTGNSHRCCSTSCPCSSAQTVDGGVSSAQNDLTSPHPPLLRQTTYASTSTTASNKRSAWRNTFQRKKNEQTPSANV